MVRQQLGDCQLVGAAANLRLFAEKTEARHRGENGIDVDAPQIHEKHHLTRTTLSNNYNDNISDNNTQISKNICIAHYKQTVTGQGFPTWGVGTPWGCRTQIQGMSDSFPGSNTKYLKSGALRLSQI